MLGSMAACNVPRKCNLQTYVRQATPVERVRAISACNEPKTHLRGRGGPRVDAKRNFSLVTKKVLQHGKLSWFSSKTFLTSDFGGSSGEGGIKRSARAVWKREREGEAMRNRMPFKRRSGLSRSDNRMFFLEEISRNPSDSAHLADT